MAEVEIASKSSASDRNGLDIMASHDSHHNGDLGEYRMKERLSDRSRP